MPLHLGVLYDCRPFFDDRPALSPWESGRLLPRSASASLVSTLLLLSYSLSLFFSLLLLHHHPSIPPSRHTRAPSCSPSCSPSACGPVLALLYSGLLHPSTLFLPIPTLSPMSDETRANAPKGPRKGLKRRVLILSNPSDDSDEGRLDTQSSHSGPSYAQNHPLPPTTRVPPPPLTTRDLAERGKYPSSRSNPSNPALSSPSSTSSHVLESTPPPSTPGQSLPSVDISEGTLRPEHYPHPITHERSDSLPNHPSRASPNDRPKPQPSYSHPNHIHQVSSRPATVSPFPLLYSLPIDMARILVAHPLHT